MNTKYFMHIFSGRIALAAAILLSTLWLGGCGSYEIAGSVVQGTAPGAYVVSASDERLNFMTLNNVAVEFSLDPSSMSPKQLGRAVTDSAGQFRLPVDAMGAGSWQEYEIGVMCNHQGFRGLWQVIELPPLGKKLLIVIAPGKGEIRKPDDVLGETMKLKELLMDKN